MIARARARLQVHKCATITGVLSGLVCEMVQTFFGRDYIRSYPAFE